MPRSEFKQMYLARALDADSRSIAATRQETRECWRAIATCYRRMAELAQPS
jgi:hypothetical protein